VRKPLDAMPARPYIVLAALALVSLLPAGAGATRALRAPRAHGTPSRRAPLTVPVSVDIDRSEPGTPVPKAFLGLSFEVGSLARLAGYWDQGDLVALLRSLGPGVLRFGGVTADHEVAWSEHGDPPPPWASAVLEAGNLRALEQLAAKSGWHVLLTLNLGHFDPQAAAAEAAAAEAALGPWLQAIEIGNEPDGYVIQGVQEPSWTFAQYDEQVAAYRAAIEAVAPGIPLAGPDTYTSGSFPTWGVLDSIDQPPALLTGHYYGLACDEDPPPTIEKLLSPEVRGLEVKALQRYVKVSRLAQLPFRIDETNSVSCGGVAGISNTFASALWATAYLARAMTMGAVGVNLEGNPTNCAGYTPLCALTQAALADGRLAAQPEWYALLLLRALIGERPLLTGVRAPAGTNVYAGAFMAPDGGMHVVFVDNDPPGSRPITVKLHVGKEYAYATALTLTAPSPEAQSGVRLGGRAVGESGLWRPPRKLPASTQRSGVIAVRIAPSSAALLSVSRPPHAASRPQNGGVSASARPRP